MTREIFFYYRENTGEIMGYSKNENPELTQYEVVKIPLEEARKFYNGEAIVSDWIIDTSNPFYRTLIRKDFQRTISKFLDDSFVELKDNSISLPDVRIGVTRSVLPLTSVYIEVVTFVEEFPVFMTKMNDPSLLYESVKISNKTSVAKMTFVYAHDVSVFVDKSTFDRYKISFMRTRS